MKEITINIEDIKINNDWKEFLKEEFSKSYFLEIKKRYIQALNNKAIIYPPSNLTFNAFNLTPLSELKIVLLGQDPYHQPNQAMGLSFSVPCGVKIPPSLLNIYKELKADVKELELQIEEIKEEIIGITANPSEEKTGSTNKFSSTVENQVVQIEKRTKELNYKINKKNREIERIENAISVLLDEEKEVINIVHIQKRKYYVAQEKLNVSYSRVKQLEYQAVKRMEKYIA